MTVGEKIRVLRKGMGLTQTELGARMGVQKNAVSKWELGRVEIPTGTILALAKLFDVSPSYLIDDTPRPPVTEAELKAAFWGGEQDLSPGQLDELWEDVRAYAAFKAQQMRKKT